MYIHEARINYDFKTDQQVFMIWFKDKYFAMLIPKRLEDMPGQLRGYADTLEKWIKENPDD